MTNQPEVSPRRTGRGLPDEVEYRRAARAWLAANAQPKGPETLGDGRRAGESDEEFAARSRKIQAGLFDAGYAGIALPTEAGGQGLPGRFQQIFEQEAAGYEMPGVFGGTFGPVLGTLLNHLTPEQKAKHVTAILHGRELWSQLMSEPGAGSDIGGITTTATRDGEEWRINGQKVWTTAAHLSDYAMCLTRTDWEATKYEGLTMLVVALRSPGVTVRPLRQITGGAEFCEVFLDDVRVPAADVLGEVGRGWSVVQTWLTYEHGGVAAGEQASTAGSEAVRSPVTDSIPTDLIALARRAGTHRHPVARDQIVRVFIDTATQTLFRQSLTAAMRTGRLPSHAGSAVKVRDARNRQRHAEIAMTLAGLAGIAWDQTAPTDAAVAEALLSARRLSIAGGTNEVNLNNVGERVLGLPRDPAVDRGIPFRDVRRNTSAAGRPGTDTKRSTPDDPSRGAGPNRR